MRCIIRGTIKKMELCDEIERIDPDLIFDRFFLYADMTPRKQAAIEQAKLNLKRNNQNER